VVGLLVQYCVRAAAAAHPVGPRLIRRTLHNDTVSSSLCRKRSIQARTSGSDKRIGQPSFNLPAGGSDPLQLHNQTAPPITLQSTYCAKRDGWRWRHPSSIRSEERYRRWDPLSTLLKFVAGWFMNRRALLTGVPGSGPELSTATAIETVSGASR
jgi:hypothetical protein